MNNYKKVFLFVSSFLLFAFAEISYAQTVLLHTTLDNLSSVTSPTIGTGTGASVGTSPANDFVLGSSGNGINIDAANEYVRFQQISGATQNVELTKGTADFWYKPNYNHTNGSRHPIFSTGRWATPGSVHLIKNNSGNGNELSVYFFDSASVIYEQGVLSSNYLFTLGTWYNIRLTWDFAVAAGTPNFHVYIDSIEKPITSTPTSGPFSMPAESSTNYVYIGNRSNTGGGYANGVLDEARVYNSAVPPPTPPGDTTPPILSNGSPSGILPANTTQTTLSLSTNENATCRYSTTAGTAYSGMTNTFSTTGATSHSTTVTGLTNGSSYNYYVRCQDSAGNVNTSDFTISFSVAIPAGDTTPPTVSIISPFNGSYPNGMAVISANATDNVAVSSVEFFLDNVSLGTDTSAPYEKHWDTSVSTDGAHTLHVIATDSSNNTTQSATISINIDSQSKALGFFDHFASGTLNSRWTSSIAGTGSISIQDSFLECSSPTSTDACMVRLATKIDKNRSQLFAFAVSDHTGTFPQSWVSVVNSAVAPTPETSSLWNGKQRLHIGTAQNGSTLGITFDYWDASHTPRHWDGIGNTWNSSSVLANSPIKGDDYYVVGLELDGPNNRWRMVEWGKRSASSGSYTFEQGLRTFALTDWVSWSSLEDTSNLWLVLGDALTDSGAGSVRMEWARKDTGAKQDVWVNSKSAGDPYRIKHGWGYESAQSGIEMVVQEDRTGIAVNAGALGSWDSWGVKDQYVLFDPASSMYYMYYTGGDGSFFNIGLATSPLPNGPFTKYSPNPILPRIAGTAEDSVINPALVKDIGETDSNKRFKLLYGGLQQSDFRVFLATAPAAIGPWTRQGMVLDVGQTGAFDQNGYTRPRPVFENGQWYVFVSAKNNSEIGSPFRISYATGPNLSTLTPSGVILVDRGVGPAQNITATFNGRTAKVANTTGFMPDAFFLIDQDNDTDTLGMSRIRKVVDSTTLELYHGLDGFTTNNPAKIVQVDGQARIEVSDIAKFGNTWHLVTTPFHPFGMFTGLSAGHEGNGLLTAGSLTGPYNWNYVATPMITLGSWNNNRSNENLTFLHRPITPIIIPDTTPPLISNVNSSGITQTTATISWTTDEVSDSQVEYGPTTSYGNQTALNSSFVASHNENLSGLSSNTLYHYRVKSKDAAGNLATGNDFTFTTLLPANQAPIVNAGTDQIIALPSSANLVGNASDDGLPNPPGTLNTTWSMFSGPGSVIFGNANALSTIASFSLSGSYVLRLTANDSTLSATDDMAITVNSAPDTTPPSIPTNLSLNVISSSQINLSWTASTDDVGVAGYKIYRCQNASCSPTIQIATSTSVSYQNTGLNPSTTYAYAVSAYDASGNESAKSSTIEAATLPPPAQTPLLHTTLNDASSVSTPAIGTGSGSSINTSPLNDFVLGSSGNGININASGEYVRFQQISGATQNIELTKGTADFWYKPNYNHTDPVIPSVYRYSIFSTGAWATPGSIHLIKGGSVHSNQLFIYFFDAAGTIRAQGIPSANYSFIAGTWYNIRLTWDFTVSAGIPNFHVYIDSLEKSIANTPTSGPFSMPAESATNYVYIGNRTSNSSDLTHANGILDEIKIYDVVLQP